MIERLDSSRTQSRKACTGRRDIHEGDDRSFLANKAPVPPSNRTHEALSA